MCPPGERLQVRNDEQSARVQTSVVCQLHPDRVAEWFETPSRYPVLWTDSQLKFGLDLPANNVRWLLDRVAAELLNPQLATDTMIELMISQIAVAVARMCGVDIDRTASGGLTPWRLRLIDERLNDLQSPATLSDLSALCKMSVRQLTRGFRLSRGQSIGDYITERRIDHAKSMLTTDESVKSIAYQLGYASSSSFACAFRNSTGQSPRDYRELTRNATNSTPPPST
jgi:AraC family transcriptional regulator